MSAATLASTDVRIPRGRTLIGLGPAVRAESERARRSGAARLPWLGLAVCVLEGLGWLTIVQGVPRSWTALFAWQTLFGTGLVGGVAALLAGLVVAREKAARDGGTWARPVSARTTTAARLIVMSLQTALLIAFVTFPLLAFGPMVGLSHTPWAMTASLWAVLVAASLPPLVLGFAIARRAGTVAAVALGMVWQIVGVLSMSMLPDALNATMPWAWGVRALMPVIGIHANGTALEPGSPIAQWAWWWPMLGDVALAAVLALAVIASARVDPASPARRGLLARLAGSFRPGGRGELAASPPQAISASERAAALAVPARTAPVRRLAAALLVLRRTGAWVLVAVAVVVLALVALVWNDAYVLGLTVWFVVPAGACVLASIVSSTAGSGWRVAALRSSATAQAAMLGAVCLVMLTIVVGGAGLLALASGGSAGETLRVAGLAWLVGAVALAVGLFLATRFGPAVLFGATMVLMVLSLVLGGTQIAETPAWIAGFFGWPFAADSPGRVLAVAVLCVLIGAAGTWGWARSLRRAASLA